MAIALKKHKDDGCNVTICGKPHKSKGLCNACYQRQYARSIRAKQKLADVRKAVRAKAKQEVNGDSGVHIHEDVADSLAQRREENRAKLAERRKALLQVLNGFSEKLDDHSGEIRMIWKHMQAMQDQLDLLCSELGVTSQQQEK